MVKELEPICWEIYKHTIGHRIWVEAEIAKDFLRIHVPHIYIVKHKEEDRKDYDGKEFYTMRSMTGQICTLTFENHRGVVRCEYSYAVAHERLAHDRIFYPNREGTNVKDAKKWFRSTAIRLMKLFWEDHQHGLCDGKEKFKELRLFIDKCFEMMEGIDDD